MKVKLKKFNGQQIDLDYHIALHQHKYINRITTGEIERTLESLDSENGQSAYANNGTHPDVACTVNQLT